VTGQLRWAVGVGLCVVLAFGVSSALLIMMSLILPVMLVTLTVGPRLSTALSTLVPTLVAAALAIAYPVWRQWSVLERAVVPGEVASVGLLDWFRAPRGALSAHLPWVPGVSTGETVLYPGSVLLLLAIAGASVGFRSHRRWVLGATLCALVALLLSFDDSVAGFSASAPLAGFHPGLEYLRHADAYAMVFHALLIGLASVVFARFAAPRFERRRRVFAVLVLLAAGEGVSLQGAQIAPPELSSLPWMTALEGRPANAIAHVGIDGVGANWQDVHSTFVHRQPVVGGPTLRRTFQSELLGKRVHAFPTLDGVAALREQHVTSLVVDKDWLNPERSALLSSLDGVERIYDDESHRVYALAPLVDSSDPNDVSPNRDAAKASPGEPSAKKRQSRKQRRKRRR
ncbi:MAG: hypothetical protein AAF658_11990, partial [Myxococcota bacterium]